MKESIIYPGEYIPATKTESLHHELRSSLAWRHEKAPVNMTENGDTITIEVALPGANRDEISVCTEYNILMIWVLGNIARKETGEQQQLHEFDIGCLERHIVLPEQADTDFMSAEFKQGVLCLHIPKGRQSIAATSRQVVVY
jgi:HSP20 family protein